VEPELIRRYESPEGAAAYRRKYDRSLLRRVSNRRELAIVTRALERAGAKGHVLDCPCGAGRLVPTILERAERVTAADVSAAMVEQAREALASYVAERKVTLAVASAEELPFADDTFDTVVCHRLLHHVQDPEERARMLGELGRVARESVVLSFNDATTRKARSQERRGRRGRVALSPTALRDEAAVRGLVMDGPVIRLNGFFSLVAVAVFRVEPSTVAVAPGR
jgi:SAM-dependent methyltransferase